MGRVLSFGLFFGVGVLFVFFFVARGAGGDERRFAQNSTLFSKLLGNLLLRNLHDIYHLSVELAISNKKNINNQHVTIQLQAMQIAEYISRKFNQRPPLTPKPLIFSVGVFCQDTIEYRSFFSMGSATAAGKTI